MKVLTDCGEATVFINKYRMSDLTITYVYKEGLSGMTAPFLALYGQTVKSIPVV